MKALVDHGSGLQSGDTIPKPTLQFPAGAVVKIDAAMVPIGRSLGTGTSPTHDDSRRISGSIAAPPIEPQPATRTIT